LPRTTFIKGKAGTSACGRTVFTQVLSEIDADIVALQEMACIEGKGRERNQAQYIAEELRVARAV